MVWELENLQSKMMNYSDTNFDNLKECAKLYGLALPTAQRWVTKSDKPIPWRDPHQMLEWYRTLFGREPGKRVSERIAILHPQMLRWEQENLHSDQPHGAVGDPPTKGDKYRPLIETKADRGDTSSHECVTGDTLSRKEFFEEVCADLANARTLARIASEEREAYDNYKEIKAKGWDYSAEVRRWQDLTKVKREWAKTQDAVDLAFRALRNWLRSEWEPQWKELRTALDGRRMGMEAREDLLASGEDAVEWRRVWDMHMERVILEILDNQKDGAE